MTTIQVKLRHSGVQGKAGTIYYQITRGRKTRPDRYTPSDRTRTLAAGRAQRIAPAISQTPEGRLLRHRIEHDIASLRRIVRELDTQGNGYGPDDIIMRFRIMAQRITVAESMRREIDELTNSNRLGTARNYRRALNSFMSFLGAKDIPFSAVTESLIDEYNGFLIRRGVVRNTVSFYMRILRAVYNKAVPQVRYRADLSVSACLYRNRPYPPAGYRRTFHRQAMEAGSDRCPLSPRWHAISLFSVTARAAWLSSTWPICKRKISGTMKSSTRVAKPDNRYASASNRACARSSSGMRRRLIRLTFSRFCGQRNLTRPFPSIRRH